ncbi:hypothetical protein WOLCODRAFT_158615 [Wolfiporia cocos MD-104 SS10]|uniref:Argonaute linker 1 domain-containing protein n=1 Tax=Wolfiporia cocos (strain MD-104) TaxID=742152 RepID=A0A2H3JA27_WOLCO|nr:hypothetical protein WOLCODRAFT_158615 [Wolfiporia cocos MD-104 SS10]
MLEGSSKSITVSSVGGIFSGGIFSGGIFSGGIFSGGIFSPVVVVRRGWCARPSSHEHSTKGRSRVQSTSADVARPPSSSRAEGGVAAAAAAVWVRVRAVILTSVTCSAQSPPLIGRGAGSRTQDGQDASHDDALQSGCRPAAASPRWARAEKALEAAQQHRPPLARPSRVASPRSTPTPLNSPRTTWQQLRPRAQLVASVGGEHKPDVGPEEGAFLHGPACQGSSCAPVEQHARRGARRRSRRTVPRRALLSHRTSRELDPVRRSQELTWVEDARPAREMQTPAKWRRASPPGRGVVRRALDLGAPPVQRALHWPSVAIIDRTIGRVHCGCACRGACAVEEAWSSGRGEHTRHWRREGGDRPAWVSVVRTQDGKETGGHLWLGEGKARRARAIHRARSACEVTRLAEDRRARTLVAARARGGWRASVGPAWLCRVHGSPPPPGLVTSDAKDGSQRGPDGTRREGGTVKDLERMGSAGMSTHGSADDAELESFAQGHHPRCVPGMQREQDTRRTRLVTRARRTGVHWGRDPDVSRHATGSEYGGGLQVCLGRGKTLLRKPEAVADLTEPRRAATSSAARGTGRQQPVLHFILKFLQPVISPAFGKPRVSELGTRWLHSIRLTQALIDSQTDLAACPAGLLLHAANTGTRVGKNRYFFGGSSTPMQLSMGVEAWRGFFISVRPTYKRLMVNANVCMTAFYTAGNLANAIIAFYNQPGGGMPSRFYDKFKVSTTHLGYIRKKAIFRVESKTARQSRFQCDERARRSGNRGRILEEE